MYGYDILCGISKLPFEIPHKISYSYIEWYDFLYNIEILRALRFKSSYAFLKRPPEVTERLISWNLFSVFHSLKDNTYVNIFWVTLYWHLTILLAVKVLMLITYCSKELIKAFTLQWRYNERDGVSNHRRLDCLLHRLFGLRLKKTSKLRVTGLYDGIYWWPVVSLTKGGTKPLTEPMPTYYQLET